MTLEPNPENTRFLRVNGVHSLFGKYFIACFRISFFYHYSSQKNIPSLTIRTLKPGRNSYILETEPEFIIAAL